MEKSILRQLEHQRDIALNGGDLAADRRDCGVQLSLAPAKNEHISAFGYKFLGCC
jgi:hypothetical protein